MPKISRSPLDEESPVAVAVQAALENTLLQVVGMPIFFAGVNRKANTGNFENIDVYSALAIPMGVASGELNVETLRTISAEAAQLGFGIVSEETFMRYDLIKRMQEGD